MVETEQPLGAGVRLQSDAEDAAGVTHISVWTSIKVKQRKMHEHSKV